MNSGLMTVENYLSKKSSKKTPYLRLCGVWLNDCGFNIGTQYTIECNEGLIILKTKQNVDLEVN